MTGAFVCTGCGEFFPMAPVIEIRPDRTEVVFCSEDCWRVQGCRPEISNASSADESSKTS